MPAIEITVYPEIAPSVELVETRRWFRQDLPASFGE